MTSPLLGECKRCKGSGCFLCDELGIEGGMVPPRARPEDFLGQLRRLNAERQTAWVDGGAPVISGLFHATELGGEVGEALNEVKKLHREEMGWRGSRSTKEKLALELADVLICLDKLAEHYGIDLIAATVEKFNATSDKVGLPQRLALPTMRVDATQATAPETVAIAESNQAQRSEPILPTSEPNEVTELVERLIAKVADADRQLAEGIEKSTVYSDEAKVAQLVVWKDQLTASDRPPSRLHHHFPSRRDREVESPASGVGAADHDAPRRRSYQGEMK
jgi:NTP pyrophosphatase (non-canonical NTP hydrolase)